MRYCSKAEGINDNLNGFVSGVAQPKNVVFYKIQKLVSVKSVLEFFFLVERILT